MLIGKAGDRTDSQVVDEHGRVIANCGMEPSHQLDDDEALANARLIAAAPQLLEALQEMFALFEAHAQYDDDSAAAVKLARQAITRATGKSQPKLQKP